MPLSNVRLRQPASSGTSASLSNQWVKIQSIDTDTKTAHVINQVKATMRIPYTHMIGKTLSPPQPGEIWLISSMFGSWMFISQINQEYPVLVEDDDPRLEDTGWLTSGITGLNGNIIVSQAYRKIGHEIRVMVEYELGSTFTANSTGNVADTGIGQMPAGFLSSCPLQQTLVGAGLPPVLNGMITPAGVLTYTSSQYPSASFTTGTLLFLGGSYFD